MNNKKHREISPAAMGEFGLLIRSYRTKFFFYEPINAWVRMQAISDRLYVEVASTEAFTQKKGMPRIANSRSASYLIWNETPEGHSPDEPTLVERLELDVKWEPDKHYQRFDYDMEGKCINSVNFPMRKR